MEDNTQFNDFAKFLQNSSRGSVISARSERSEPWEMSPSPVLSASNSDHLIIQRLTTDTTIALTLIAPVTISFVKGNKLFKLKYAAIDVCKDRSGAIRCIELSDPLSLAGSFIHTFTTTKRPIPHLEEPSTATQKSVRVSFLEEQMVQVAQTIVSCQPRYLFESTNDASKFQETVMGVDVLFVAGIAEVVSKGRGEEAVSQNIRVCRYNNGSLYLLYFANSQRNQDRRYHLVPVDAIDSVEIPKKPGKPMRLKLSSAVGLTEILKTLSIVFLESVDATRMSTLLQTAGIKILGR